MNFTNQILESVSKWHLLKHPFYQAWSAGKLSKDSLCSYARQYYHHVAAFPRYISATHSGCDDIQARQVLLDNLTDEEKGEKNHPELWMRFAESLGATRKSVKDETLLPQTQALIDTFFKLSNQSYAAGLGALFAYEHQVPEVAASKIAGLEKFYGITHDEALEFFKVHLKADVYHSQACAQLLEELSSSQKEEAMASAQTASQALWGFLDGIEQETCCQETCCKVM